MGYSRTNPNKGEGEGVEDVELPGVLKEEHVKIQGVNLKRNGISRGV